jgi:hypothetical protein
MRLPELLELCANSSRADWNVIPCWGADSGPSYLDHFEPIVTHDEGFQLRHAEHSMRGSYIPDLDIGIGWGLDSRAFFPSGDRSTYETDWTDRFDDKSATVHLADFFYRGNFVHREHYLSVDGGRCYLPLPNAQHQVSQRDHDLIAVLDRLEKESEFGNYFQRSGITIR